MKWVLLLWFVNSQGMQLPVSDGHITQIDMSNSYQCQAELKKVKKDSKGLISGTCIGKGGF